ncbi:molybdopterin-dependent oxidoreductase [Methylobacterium sp. 092160098-2]|uniref:molybdopterin-dependent oxidoreductase n=1 Tax=Methylobacterium sp. 092160098-2 TaxID=3025129 RepID=UPI002381A3A5|nr:molybdopterin-dependent oxidoreductase [Methylobacterium sp. 092160098-2]MDE4915199.1 molybdopterin-dependent oxidoreductase [Methylobacterium sp. 092160098-2]
MNKPFPTPTDAVGEVRTPGFCALCKSRCGSVMVTRDGLLVAQEPNPGHPTGQALCVKGKAAPELVYNPQRQLYPMIRTRPKGDPDPGWQRVSWDEALDRAAEGLACIRDEHGPEAVAFGWTTPSGTPISDDIRWVERFTNAFGSPNVAYGTEICNWHKDHAHAYTFGRGVASPDFEKSGCIVLWGHNPSATWLDHATATGAAKARGARLVVVDPRRAGFAARADQWLRVRPGADGALALGIAGEMIRKGWFDRDFVTRWTNGPLLVRTDTNRFLRAGEMRAPPAGAGADDLVAWGRVGASVAYAPATRTYAPDENPVLEAAVEILGADGDRIACRTAFGLYRDLCDAYPLDRVEQLAWVPAAQVTATARMLFEAAPVSYYVWSGVGQHTNATQTDRAISILMALTGSFDAPGGNVEFAKPAARDVTGGEFLSAMQRAKCIDLARSPLGPGRHGWIGADALYDAILDSKPYAVCGLFDFGRNFLVNHANGDRGARALANLQFHVHTDVVVTPTAAFADVFLPVNTPWEREALRVGFEGSQRAESLVQLRQAAVPSQGESRSDAQIVFDLATRLGFGDRFWHGDIEAGFAAVLEPLGLTVDELRRHLNGITVLGEPHYHRHRSAGVKTRTGKIEIFSEVLRDAGQDPLPKFVEPAISPFREGSEALPLVLTSAKVVHCCHGQHRNVASLRKRSPDPEVTLHPDTAGERGIAAGDWVDIRTGNGQARMRAKLDGFLDPRVVSAQYGWWQSNEALGLPAYNALADTGANYNRLVSDDHVDPVSGSTGLRSSLCEVTPVKVSGGRAWAGWRPFELAIAGRETTDIVSFRLTPTDGGALPPFRGGQHITLRLAGPEGMSPVRCYSLSRATDGASYRISVKLARGADEAVGRMSGLLHGAADGIAIDVQAPKGAFHLPTAEAGEATAVLVAAGIGITPLLSMIYETADSDRPRPIHLLYGVRSSADHAFRDELADLERRTPTLRVTTFYSAGVPVVPDAGSDVRTGRVTVADVLAVATPGAQIYLCGPAAMVEALTTGLEQAGVDGRRIYTEEFGPSSRATGRPDQGPQRVELARAGRTLIWDPSAGSLLDAIDRQGVVAASGCRSGQCECCIVGILSGEVDHPAGSAPVDAGRCLPCVAVPLTAVVLDL